MRQLRCREVGFDCDAVVRAESDEEVMRQVAEHGRQVHGLERIDEETERTIRSKIHDA